MTLLPKEDIESTWMQDRIEEREKASDAGSEKERMRKRAIEREMEGVHNHSIQYLL